jgi:hypothetical protein
MRAGVSAASGGTHVGDVDTSSPMRMFRMGLGRDSVAGLCLLIEEGLVCKGVRIHPQDIDVLVFTDPGAEWQHTYAVYPYVGKLCKEAGIRCLFQRKPPEDEQEAWIEVLSEVRERMWAEDFGTPEYWEHRVQLRKMTPPWQDQDLFTIEERAEAGYYHRRVDIFKDYQSKRALIRFTDGGCTENHKILPNRRLMNDLCMERYGITCSQWGAEVQKGNAEPHQVLLFIAADEAQRVYNDRNEPPYYEESVYPLVEMGVSKPDEAEILQRHGLDWVQKSGCVGCKYQGVEFFWALSVLEPAKFDMIEKYEAIAADRNDKMVIFPKTKGRPRIREAASRWREANPTLTAEEVMERDYKRCDRRGKPISKKEAVNG